MDRKTIVTIAITALVTWTVKELADALKKTIISDKIKTKASKIFSQNNRWIMLDCLWISVSVAGLVWTIFFDRNPINAFLLRILIVRISLNVMLLGASLFLLIYHITAKQLDRRESGLGAIIAHQPYFCQRDHPAN